MMLRWRVDTTQQPRRDTAKVASFPRESPLVPRAPAAPMSSGLFPGFTGDAGQGPQLHPGLTQTSSFHFCKHSSLRRKEISDSHPHFKQQNWFFCQWKKHIYIMNWRKKGKKKDRLDLRRLHCSLDTFLLQRTVTCAEITLSSLWFRIFA